MNIPTLEDELEQIAIDAAGDDSEIVRWFRHVSQQARKAKEIIAELRAEIRRRDEHYNMASITQLEADLVAAREDARAHAHELSFTRDIIKDSIRRLMARRGQAGRTHDSLDAEITYVFEDEAKAEEAIERLQAEVERLKHQYKPSTIAQLEADLDAARKQVEDLQREILLANGDE